MNQHPTLYRDLEILAYLRAQLADTKQKIAEIEAPLKAAIAEATGALRQTLADHALAEQRWTSECVRNYKQASQARTAALKAGIEAPAVAVPDGCSVRHVTVATVSDVDALPRQYLGAPALPQIKRDLVQRQPVPGAALAERIDFVFKA
jgi:hypothetical protein